MISFVKNLNKKMPRLLADGFGRELRLLKATSFLVGTIVACFVKFLRHAGHQRDRAVEQAIDFRQGNLTRIPDQTIAAFRALLAAHVSSAFEIEKNLFKKLFRNILGAGDFVCQQLSATKISAQPDQRLKGVLAFL